MKIQLDFMELILLQKIKNNPGQIDWDSHPKIDKLMRMGLCYFLRSVKNGEPVIMVFISEIGNEVLFHSLPTQDQPRVVELWN